MKSILLIGGSGFVGCNMAVLAARQGLEVTISDRTPRVGLDDIHWKSVDITDRNAVDTVVSTTSPDAVVNLAAMANIDQAEQNKKKAWAINVEGAKNVAASCADRNIRHIFFSTDAVFDGTAPLYTEEDLTSPVNYYGYTKAEAEKAVLDIYPHAVVVRISLVLGFPVADGNAFYAGLEKKLKDGKIVQSPSEEIRTPVDVFTLSECVLELATKEFSGALHIASSEPVDRLTLAKMLAKRMGYDTSLVVPVKDVDPGRAPRHKNGIIDTSRARQLLDTRLLNLDQSIQRSFIDRIIRNKR